MGDGWKSSEQIENLSGDLQRVREDLAAAQRCVEVEELQSALAALAAERDQLKMDLQENVEMVSPRVCFTTPATANGFWSEVKVVCDVTQMIENQGELMAALQRNQEQKELIKQLEKGQVGSPDGSEHLQTQVTWNQEELNCIKNVCSLLLNKHLLLQFEPDQSSK